MGKLLQPELTVKTGSDAATVGASTTPVQRRLALRLWLQRLAKHWAKGESIFGINGQISILIGKTKKSPQSTSLFSCGDV